MTDPTTPKLPAKAKHCVGCEQNFYNGNNGLGVKVCWHLKGMRLILRRRVGLNEVPPWTATPRKLPDCYRQQGAIFVGPKVER